MTWCAVKNCSQQANFRILKVVYNQSDTWKEVTERRRRLWCRQIGRKEITPIGPMACLDHHRIKRHFLSGSPASPWDQSNPDWIPTLHMENPTAKPTNSDRFKRVSGRNKSKIPVVVPSKKAFALCKKDGDVVQSTSTNADDKESVGESQLACGSGTAVSDEHRADSTGSCENARTSPSHSNEHCTSPHSSVEASEVDMETEIVDRDFQGGVSVEEESFERNGDSGIQQSAPFIFVKVQPIYNDKSNNVDLEEDEEPADDTFMDAYNFLQPPMTADCSTANVTMPDLQSKCEQCEQQSKRIKELQTENLHLGEQNDYLKQKLKKLELNESAFENKDDKVMECTGLQNCVILLSLFQLVAPYLNRARVLTPFQQFLLCIMKMRLNLPISVLALLFQVSKATVSRVFSETLNVLYVRMDPFIRWPEREELFNTMPKCFQRLYGKKVTVIIDCFEIHMEKPTDLKARAQTYSNYKGGNTVKFLIGIAPQGVITFISEGWGGRTSDKHLTEHSGFMEHLRPGDLILADRGFNIDESVVLKCADIKIPAFTKGKSQLCPLDVERTRKLASVRIHVERVIGNLRQKYPILSGNVPVDYVFTDAKQDVTMLTKMVRVCSALINICSSVVPFD